MSTMTMQEMAAKLAKLEAENAALKAHTASKITLKVSAKGAISVYGLGRWPVTLYAPTWETLAGMMPEIAKFAKANADKLSKGKDDPRFATVSEAAD
jgi:hypothetical protein